MAGRSQRFFDAGYSEPKYKLPLGDETLFAKAVKTFEKYFSTDEFLFIVRNAFGAEKFVTDCASGLGIEKFSLSILESDTGGQAESVYLGLIKKVSDEPLFIFNIDTIRSQYVKPTFLDSCDGYLEVFIGSGDHWSFVEPNGSRNVARTSEKVRISNLCSDGLYYFKSSLLFIEAFLDAKNNSLKSNGEFYIAPLYNYLIKGNKTIHYDLIDSKDLVFCGTPQEYEQALLTCC